MKRRRVFGSWTIALVAACGLAGCTPAIPVAYKLSDDIVDIAFCRTFDAASVEIDFGRYPPPFMGSLYSIGLVTGAGITTQFGNGRPVLSTVDDWTFSGNLEAPEDWERVDFSFYDVNGEYVAGEYLFARDVTQTGWAWAEGQTMAPRQCELDLNPAESR